MTAFKGHYLGAAVGGATQEVHRVWQQTPKWHPRYWFGYRMRLAVGFRNGIRPWAYRSFEHHARVVLEAQAAGVHLAWYDPPGALSVPRGPPPFRIRRPKI